MDMVLTWVLFGMVAAILSGLYETFSTREEMVTSGFLGVIGAVFGGLFGETVLRSSIAFNYVSPLIFAVVGALMFIAIFKRYPRLM